MHKFLFTFVLSQLTSAQLGPGGVASRSTITSIAPSTTPSIDPDVAMFGQAVNVLGLMERTDQDFIDGLALDLFSPVNRTLVVTQNNSPLPGRFVSGSTGAPFEALSNYSYIIKINETANDLIAKIELPYDPIALQKIGIDQGNTYVGTLAADGKSWVVSESQRNVHISENKTRIIKMTSLEGEYILLGRRTEDVSNIFVQYGQGATRTVNVTGGPGIQEDEFVDGLRFTIESDQAFTMNVDLKNGVPQDSVPGNSMSVNTFAWVVNTSMPAGVVKAAELRVPFNCAILAIKSGNKTNPEERLLVARRSLNATSFEKFMPLPREFQKVLKSESLIQVSNLTQLDGQYALIIS